MLHMPLRSRTSQTTGKSRRYGSPPRDGSRNEKVADGAAPAWSLDSRRLAFLSANQIWIFEIGSKAWQATGHPSAIRRFDWSPDGRKIAFTATDVRRSSAAQTDLRMDRLWVLDLASRKTTALTPDDYSAGGYDQWFPDALSWSPDSREVAFSKRPHGNAGSHLSGDIAAVGLEGGPARLLVRREGMDVYPRWSPTGRELAFISSGVYDWVKLSRLCVVSRTGEMRTLTEGFDQSVKEFHWSGDGGRIYFIAGRGTTTQIFALDLRSGRLRQITSGTGVYSHLSISQSGARFAFVFQSPESAPEVFVSSTEAVSGTLVSGVNRHLAGVAVPKAETVRWKSFDGMEIEGILYKPAHSLRGQRYPLLVVVHGGPHEAVTNGFPTREPLLFPGLGWMVFCPNFRGSGNYGERFLRANIGDWGGGDFQDVMTGVDHLIAAGLVDPGRLAIWGESFGGYLSAWATSQTDRFRAAVIGCAITDLPSFVRTTDVPERFESYLGKDPKSYSRHSPMSFAGRMKTPALIWHGDADARVPRMQGRHLYTHLRSRGIPTEFAIYYGEGHGLQLPANQRDLFEREVRWLSRWVQGENR